MTRHSPMAIEPQKNKRHGAIAIWSITPNGLSLGTKISRSIKESLHFTSKKILPIDLADKEKVIVFEKLSDEIEKQFNEFSGHVFIFSTGIAIRIIAPMLKSKIVDPGVVVIDDNGNNVISLLSGHLGGANSLAIKISKIINANPVITTATDTNLLPAIDLIAQESGLHIETPENIKHINMAFLMGEEVNLFDPLELIKAKLPNTTRVKTLEDRATPQNIFDNKPLCAAIYCSHETKYVSRETLILRPRILSVGIGCNRGTSCDTIQQLLLFVLKKEGLSVNCIQQFATTNVKEDEKGLLMLSREMNIPLVFYDKNELNSVTTIENPSKMAEKHLGVKSVCEAAAILASNGKLIVPKKKNKDVTIAVAIKK
jgi:cobalt-precorrin 5A hydrolase